MNECACGCGQECLKTYKKGHARKNKATSTEHRQKLSESNKGKKHAPPVYKKERKIRIWTVEERSRHSIIAKEKGFGKWMEGKKLSDESRTKISESNKGRNVSETTREKISIANSASKNGMYGKQHTQEAKLKISSTAVEMWKRPEIRSRCETEDFKNQMRRANRLVKTPKKSGIEDLLSELLNQLSIKYNRHHLIDDIEHSFLADFFFPESNLILECDGIYWHHYPVGLSIDHIRNEELRGKGYALVRIWEHEVLSLDKHLLMEIITHKSKQGLNIPPPPKEYLYKIEYCQKLFG